MTKASDNEFPKVILKPLGLASAPSDASWKLYPMADGVYARSSNSIVGPLGAGGGGAVATDVIWDAKGDLAGGTGANTAAKLTVGANNLFLQAASDEATGLRWRESGLLAVNRYAPTTQTIFSSISSATLADVDATNMAVTFTAPASTNVLVRLSAFADISAGTGDAYWGLREATTDLAFSVGRVIRGGNASTSDVRVHTIYLAGISAGSHTYKWSFATDGSSTQRIIVMDGSAVVEWAPGIMEVWAAP